MKLLIAGSRDITDIDLSEYVTAETTLIISGGAAGVDTLAEQYAEKHRISKLILYPNYELYKKAAPLKRNDKMAEICDTALIFWDGKSKGTKHTIDYLKNIGKEANVILVKDKKESKDETENISIMGYIKKLCEQRNWTYYRLAKTADIPHSSLNTMINKQAVPSMRNLIKICNAFDITPAEFFAGMETPSDEAQMIMNMWHEIDEKAKQLATAYLYGLANKEMP
ncbi:MAG: helix-turn-helix domain-containing protein [Oscillospiraceae bacterium]|nr:helix-turn-helix domain-containing protein [Oscillospiraceae bacterium]